MANAFSRAIDVIFADGNFTVAATYSAPNGSPVVCTIIRAEQDQTLHIGNGRPILQGRIFEVRASEIPSPVKDGIFTINSVDHTIVGDPETTDPERLVWRCTVR